VQLHQANESSEPLQPPELLSPLSHINDVKNEADSAAPAITFVVLQDPKFETNLGTSSLWLQRELLPHEWLVLQNTEDHSISYLYSCADAFASNDLVVFLHSDVVLPDTWYDAFLEKYRMIEGGDPNWGVLCAAGVPEGWPESPVMSHVDRIATSITDMGNPYPTGADGIPVQTCDEQLLVVRRLGGPKFDPYLPGIDLYGTDIVLSARAMGMRAYLLNVPSYHKIVDVDGQPYTPESSFAAQESHRSKMLDPAYAARAQQTIQHLEMKWCDSGLLPVHSCAPYAVQQLPSCE
jgi:hypothetical protein